MEAEKEQIIKSAQNGTVDFPAHLLNYISIALKISYKYIEQADWENLVKCFYFCISKSPKIELPITRQSGETQKELPWDYPNRQWVLYSHMIAKAYGWDLKTISCLHPAEVLARIQEILVDEQLEQEFYYSISETAYSYDARSKKSKFVPLPRPSWMRPKVEPEKIKKIIIPASMLPFGVINPNALPDEYLPKEYEAKKT